MNAKLAPAIFLRFFRASVLAGGFGKSWGLDGILAGTNKIANPSKEKVRLSMIG